MTSESTGSSDPSIFDADTHDERTKKAYYHTFDDDSVEKLMKYFKVDEQQEVLFRYLKNRKVPRTTPNDV